MEAGKFRAGFEPAFAGFVCFCYCEKKCCGHTLGLRPLGASPLTTRLLGSRLRGSEAPAEIPGTHAAEV